jgi:hypothetical protein
LVSLKDEVCKTNPQTLAELSKSIRRDISTISEQELQEVNNFFRSCTE